MEKQNLIKYYCALFLVLVVLTGSNSAVAQTSSPTSIPIDKPTITASPAMTQSSEQPKAESNNNMLFPLLLSIIALAASGGAIALTILKNKEIGISTSSLDTKLKSLEKRYADLLISQSTSSPNQQPDKSIRSYENFSNTNVYLEVTIEGIAARVSEIENSLQVAQNNNQSINYSQNTYSYNQSPNLKADIDPFKQTAHLSQSNVTQSLEDLSYIELVNTYNSNPKLLEQRAIKVSEPTDSINRRHTDSSQKIVLEKANNSNYWVIHNDIDISCWLLPKSKLRIDQFRYETTKALFECQGYQPEYSSFKLVKPAKVIPLSTDEQTWQLEEPGILEFTQEA